MDDIAHAREELEVARATTQRLSAELTAYCKTLEPGRAVVDGEELRRLREASDWQGRVYAAEHVHCSVRNTALPELLDATGSIGGLP